MAFHRPLESDKVDDLGLFSSFVRAPVVGVLMWALGGDEAKKREAEENQKELDLQLALSENKEPHEKPIDASQLQQMIELNRSRKKGTKKMPNLIGSDLSDFGNLVLHESDEYDDSEREGYEEEKGLRRAKKMSWSDESGQDLCEVIDETSATHEPQHTSSSSISAAQPIKSSVKRSLSMRKVNGSLSLANNDPSIRFIPKGLNPGHGGIIYPTHPNSQAKPSGGYISPDGWGWYITTTPPTPDMYYHSSKQGKKSSSLASGASSKRSSVLTNPAFKSGNTKSAVGWPSVPL